MTKVFLGFVIIITIILGCLFYLTSNANAKIDTYYRISEVIHKLYDGDKPICTGAFIKSSDELDLFLTAAHCGYKGKKFNVKVTEGKKERTINLKRVRSHRDQDVMLFRTVYPKGNDFKVAPLAEQSDASTLKFGSKLVSVGFPLMDGMTIAEGRLQQKDRKGKFPGLLGKFYRTTLFIAGGASGSPLWMKTADGWKVTGVASHGYDGTPWSYYASLHSIRTLTVDLL